MRSSLNTAGATMAPKMPVSSTTAMVSEGEPPRLSAMAMAIGPVADLGAMATSTPWLAPATRPRPQAPSTAIRLPTSRLVSSGPARRVSGLIWAYSGMASATVTGPSRKCTNCAPAKYF